MFAGRQRGGEGMPKVFATTTSSSADRAVTVCKRREEKENMKAVTYDLHASEYILALEIYTNSAQGAS